MIFCKKKQARIWCINLLYKHEKVGAPLIIIRSHPKSVVELEGIFGDDTIFSYEKGDLEYFQAIYNSVVSNHSEIQQKIRAHFVSSSLMSAALACFLAEQKLGMEKPLLISIYANFLAEYGELDTYRILSRISE